MQLDGVGQQEQEQIFCIEIIPDFFWCVNGILYTDINRPEHKMKVNGF